MAGVPPHQLRFPKARGAHDPRWGASIFQFRRWPNGEVLDRIADDESGRGLLMVKAVATKCGTVLTPTGKTVWAELAVG
jgi:hypothetical protein